MGKLFQYTNIAAFTRRRIEKGYSTPKLARACSMSPRITARLEDNGLCSPDKFRVLCDHLDLKVSYFLPDDLQLDNYGDALG